MGRHIVALEEDGDISKALLKPMKKSTAVVVPTPPPPVVQESEDPDALIITGRKFHRKIPFSK